jgi:hypothetical protein
VDDGSGVSWSPPQADINAVATIPSALISRNFFLETIGFSISKVGPSSISGLIKLKTIKL